MTVTSPYSTLLKASPLIPDNKRGSIVEISHRNVDMASVRAERVTIRARRSSISTFSAIERRPPNPTNTMRQTASRGTACPFEFNLKKGIWGWEIQYRSDHTTRAHNHAAFSSALAHPVHPLVTHLVRRDGKAANVTPRDPGTQHQVIDSNSGRA